MLSKAEDPLKKWFIRCNHLHSPMYRKYAKDSEHPAVSSIQMKAHSAAH